ncbi:MAG: MmgE/PrpD family protein [Pseudomonadota bacterium]
MTLSESIADFALSLRYQDLPADVSHLARLHTLDALGVGTAASAGAVQRRMRDSILRSNAQAGGCTVLGAPDRANGASAALLNGSFIHALEYDDTHMASIVHGSAVLVPAALSAAEQNGLTLGELVRLITIGWEVLVRVGLAAPGAFQRRGFQVTSVGGALVSALMAGVADGATREELVWAQGIAGSQASGIFEFLSEGATVKALHPGWAAHAGLIAAQLAVAGLTGPSTVYEGRFGLYKTYTDDQNAGDNLRLELASLGQRWTLREAAFKLFPCCHYIHPFLEGVQQIAPPPGSLQDIVSIECQVPQGAAAIICEPWQRKQTPAILNEAKYSLPYCMALAFLGIPITAEHFLAAQVNAEAVAFAQKISWTPMINADFPRKFEAEICIVLRSGEKITTRIDQVKGSADRPASIDEIKEKFITNTRARYAPDVQQGLIGLLLDGAADTPVAELGALLRG